MLGFVISKDLETVAGRIRFLRKARGLTQEDLAKKVFVTQPAVAQWERGHCRPGNASQRMLAETLGVSRSFLMGDDVEAVV